MTSEYRRWTLGLVLLVAAAACSDHEFHPPSEGEQVERADSAYSATLFDTVSWSSHSARMQAGNLVFADECRRCHGTLGRGGTDYAEEQELSVPSLVEPDWEYVGSVDTVRHRIFVGHATGMPQWGVGHLDVREIDAVAAYILLQLRPEILSDSTTGHERLDESDG